MIIYVNNKQMKKEDLKVDNFEIGYNETKSCEGCYFANKDVIYCAFGFPAELDQIFGYCHECLHIYKLKTEPK